MAQRIPVIGADGVDSQDSAAGGARDSGDTGNWNRGADASDDPSDADDDTIPGAARPGWKAQFERNLASHEHCRV